MGDIFCKFKQVALVFPAEAQCRNVLLAEGVLAGQTLYLTDDGTYALADANGDGTEQVRMMALESAREGQAISALKEGTVAGFDLVGLDCDALVYQSNTPGALSDAPGTVSVPCGIVVPLTDPVKTKVLYFNPRWAEDFI